MFTAVQKGLFPLVFIPCFIICFILYKFGKRPLKGTASFNDRMEPLYSFSAAALLGTFFFQALPNATGPSGTQAGSIASGFIVLGLFIMLCIQKIQRVSNENPYYVSPELNAIEIRFLINPETIEFVDFYEAFDLESDTTAEDRLKLADERAELKKRRRICILTIVILSILCLFEGFFLVYREPTALGGNWSIFVFFMLDKTIQSVVIATSMLHSFMQAEIRKYFLIVGIWCTACILSTVPALADMDWTLCFTMVNHVATSIGYAFVGGFLLWIALYYMWIDRVRVDKCDTIYRLFVFGVVSIICWINGYFI